MTSSFKVDAEGREDVTREEGEVLHPYFDALKYGTICVGHLIKPGEIFASTVTHEECMSILDRDLAPIETELGLRVLVDFAQCQVNAMTSWLVNCGTGALAHSQILSAINGGRIRDVPVLLEAWSKGRLASGGPLVTVPFLLARRRREGAIFARAWLLEASPPIAPETPPRSVLTDAEEAYLESLQFDLAEGAYQDYLAARREAADKLFEKYDV